MGQLASLLSQRHVTLIQSRLNVDATSWCCIDHEPTLYKRHVPAGHTSKNGPVNFFSLSTRLKNIGKEANSVDRDRTLLHYIWAYTVCSGSSVRKLRVDTALVMSNRTLILFLVTWLISLQRRMLTVTTLWDNSTDWQNWWRFLIFFQKNRHWHFMKIVSYAKANFLGK